MIFKDIDILEVLNELGIEPFRIGISNITARCPSGDHADRKPSWSIRTDPTDGRLGAHRCFSCGFSGGLVKLWAKVRDVSVYEARQQIEEKFGKESRLNVFDESLETREIEAAPKKELKYIEMPFEFEYLKPDMFHWQWLNDRGVSDEIIKKYKIGYCTKKDPKYPNWLIVPILFGGDAVAFMARNVYKKQFLYSEHAPIEQVLFNWDNVDLLKNEIILCEGIFDVLRVLSVCDLKKIRGHVNIVALLGNSINNQQPRWRLIQPFNKVISCSDADDGGDKMDRDIIDTFSPFSRISKINLPRGNDPGDAPLNVLVKALSVPSRFKKTKVEESQIVDYEVRE